MTQNRKENITAAKGFTFPGGDKQVWSALSIAEGDVVSGKGGEQAVIAAVIGGSVRFTMGVYEDRPVGAGEMFVVPAFWNYSIEAVQDVDLITCRFTLSVLTGCGHPASREAGGHIRNTEYAFNTLSQREPLNDFLRMVAIYLQELPPSKILPEPLRQEFFHLLLTIYPVQRVVEFLYPAIGGNMTFKEFVARNWMKARNIEELAVMTGYTRTGFVRAFTRNFNMAPHQWIVQHRAAGIREDLYAGILTKREIVAKYNFPSANALDAFCKSHLGFTALQISKQVKG